MAETYRKQETVVNFDTTSRRGGGEVSASSFSFPYVTYDMCGDHLLKLHFLSDERLGQLAPHHRGPGQ